jgi:hypothetical protein
MTTSGQIVEAWEAWQCLRDNPARGECLHLYPTGFPGEKGSGSCRVAHATANGRNSQVAVNTVASTLDLIDASRDGDASTRCAVSSGGTVNAEY